MEDVFDNMKDILHLAADTRLVVFQGSEPEKTRAFLPAILTIWLLPVGTKIYFRHIGIIYNILMFTDRAICRISVYDMVIFTNQFCCNLGIMNIGCRNVYCVNVSASCVYANMQLGSEIPLISLLGLVHFRIALAFRILGG